MTNKLNLNKTLLALAISIVTMTGCNDNETAPLSPPVATKPVPVINEATDPVVATADNIKITQSQLDAELKKANPELVSSVNQDEIIKHMALTEIFANQSIAAGVDKSDDYLQLVRDIQYRGEVLKKNYLAITAYQKQVATLSEQTINEEAIKLRYESEAKAGDTKSFEEAKPAIIDALKQQASQTVENNALELANYKRVSTVSNLTTPQPVAENEVEVSDQPLADHDADTQQITDVEPSTPSIIAQEDNVQLVTEMKTAIQDDAGAVTLIDSEKKLPVSSSDNKPIDVIESAKPQQDSDVPPAESRHKPDVILPAISVTDYESDMSDKKEGRINK